MTIKEYYRECFKIAKAQGVYLEVVSHKTRTLLEGKLCSWYEHSETECYADISLVHGREVHEISTIKSYVKKEKKIEWPKRPNIVTDLFGAVPGTSKVSGRTKRKRWH